MKRAKKYTRTLKIANQLIANYKNTVATLHDGISVRDAVIAQSTADTQLNALIQEMRQRANMNYKSAEVARNLQYKMVFSAAGQSMENAANLLEATVNNQPQSFNGQNQLTPSPDGK